MKRPQDKFHADIKSYSKVIRSKKSIFRWVQIFLQSYSSYRYFIYLFFFW